MNTAYVYQSAQVGEFRPSVLWAAGPASYVQTGDIVYNPGANEYIASIGGAVTQSGNYTVSFVPTSVGYGQVRAGAPSPSQSGWTAIWKYSGKQGVTGVTGTGGTGMTVGTYALSFSGGGGSGAAGTLTVLTATTFSIAITNTGQGYTSAPTVSAATGGTPPTLTATVAPSGGQVPASTNLSAELVQFGAFITQL